MALVLTDMALGNIERSVLCRILTFAVHISGVDVGETQNGLETFVAQHLHILVKTVQHFVGQSGRVTEVLQVIMDEHNGDAVFVHMVVQSAFLSLDGIRFLGCQVPFEHGDKTPFGIREDGVVIGCIGNRSSERGRHGKEHTTRYKN